MHKRRRLGTSHSKQHDTNQELYLKSILLELRKLAEKINTLEKKLDSIAQEKTILRYNYYS